MSKSTDDGGIKGRERPVDDLPQRGKAGLPTAPRVTDREPDPAAPEEPHRPWLVPGAGKL